MSFGRAWAPRSEWDSAQTAHHLALPPSLTRGGKPGGACGREVGKAAGAPCTCPGRGPLGRAALGPQVRGDQARQQQVCSAFRDRGVSASQLGVKAPAGVGHPPRSQLERARDCPSWRPGDGRLVRTPPRGPRPAPSVLSGAGSASGPASQPGVQQESTTTYSAGQPMTADEGTVGEGKGK